MKDFRSELKGELFLEVLKTRGKAKLAVTGASMLPSIWPGDILEVRQREMAEISPGDVVLCERQGAFLAHRVVKKQGGPERPLLITRGDTLRAPDPPVEPEELLGCVAAVWRGERRRDARLTPWRRAAAWLFCRSHLSIKVALRIRGLLV